MAVPQDPHAHMETLETTGDEDEKSGEIGRSKRYAYMAANRSRGPWFNSNLLTVKVGLTKERLIREGFYDSSIAYQSVHVNY